MTDDVKNFIEQEQLLLRDLISQVDRQFIDVRKELMNLSSDDHNKVILLVKNVAGIEGQLIAYNKIMTILDNTIKTDLGKVNEIKVIPFVRRNKDD